MTLQQNRVRPITLFVIWSRILQLFHRNDHHIETTCRVQHLGCYLEGQGHSMTLHQNRVWPKTLLFKVRIYNYFWQTTSLCPIPIRGALPGSDRLLFLSEIVKLCDHVEKNVQNKFLLKLKKKHYKSKCTSEKLLLLFFLSLALVNVKIWKLAFILLWRNCLMNLWTYCYYAL